MHIGAIVNIAIVLVIIISTVPWYRPLEHETIKFPLRNLCILCISGLLRYEAALGVGQEWHWAWVG